MGPEQFMCGNWWFIPMIFCGIMMIACLLFFARGRFSHWCGPGSWPCCCSGNRAREATLHDTIKNGCRKREN